MRRLLVLGACLGLVGCECGGSDAPMEPSATAESPSPAAQPPDDWIPALRSSFIGGNCRAVAPFEAAAPGGVLDVLCSGMRASLRDGRVTWAEEEPTEAFAAIWRSADVWFFVTQDGVVRRARTFAGELEETGRLPARLEDELSDDAIVGVDGETSVLPFVVDGNAWRIGADGVPVPLIPSLEAPVLSVAVAGDHAVLVTWPGRAWFVRAGAASPIELPGEVALETRAAAPQILLRGSAYGYTVDDTGRTTRLPAGTEPSPAPAPPLDEAAAELIARSGAERFAFSASERQRDLFLSRTLDHPFSVRSRDVDDTLTDLGDGSVIASSSSDGQWLSLDGGDWAPLSGWPLALSFDGRSRITQGGCGGVGEGSCWHMAATDSTPGGATIAASTFAANALYGDAAISTGPRVLLWRFGQPEPVPLAIADDATVTAAAFTSEGRLVATLTRGGASFLAHGPLGGPYVEHALPAGAFEVAMADARHGLASDSVGAYWTTADGGARWSELPVPASPRHAIGPLRCGASYCRSDQLLWGVPSVVTPYAHPERARWLGSARAREETTLIPDYACVSAGDPAEVTEGSLGDAMSGEVHGATGTLTWWPPDGTSARSASGRLPTRWHDDYVAYASSSSIGVARARDLFLIARADGGLATAPIPWRDDFPRTGTGGVRALPLPDGGLLVAQQRPAGLQLAQLTASGVVATRVLPGSAVLAADADGAGAAACRRGQPCLLERVDGTRGTMPPLPPAELPFCESPTPSATSMLVPLMGRGQLRRLAAGAEALYSDALLSLGPDDAWCVRQLSFRLPRQALDFSPVEATPTFVLTSDAPEEARVIGPSTVRWTCTRATSR